MDGPPDPRNLRDLIQTAQRIQAEVTRVREELASKTAEGESGGGMVRCQVSGTGDLLSLSIDPMLCELPTSAQKMSSEQKQMLEDLIVGAVNVALERARELAKQEMAKVTGGLPMPPGVFGG